MEFERFSCREVDGEKLATSSRLKKHRTQEEEEEEEEKAEDGGTGEEFVRAKLLDPNVFDCPTCLQTLTIPVFQCKNGHLSCLACCEKLGNKCPSCSLRISSIRCRAMEKVLESVKVPCRNQKYGCKSTVSICDKNNHETACVYEPCPCPFRDCDYVSSSNNVFSHLQNKHSDSYHCFRFESPVPISIGMDQNYFILEEENEGVMFILNSNYNPIGYVVSVSRVGPSSSKKTTAKVRFSYEVIARHGSHAVKLQSSVGSFGKGFEDLPPKRFLLVPTYFIASSRQLKLEIRIWRSSSRKM